MKRLIILKNTPQIIKEIEKKLDITGKVSVIHSNNLYALCYGFINKKIYISEAFLKYTSKEELEIILLHEAYHYRKNHFLKRTCMFCISSLNIFLPVLRECIEKIILQQEVMADNHAVKKSNSKKKLIHILRKTLMYNPAEFSYIPAINSARLIENRIHSLAGLNIQTKTYSLHNAVFSLVFVSVLILLMLSFPFEIFARSQGEVLKTMLIGPQSQSPVSCKPPLMFSRL